LARLKVGVVGCGYWGPNLVRAFTEIPQTSVHAVADRDRSRIEHARVRYPHIEHFAVDYRSLFDLSLDAVVVSTPPGTHFEIVRACLERGLHVFVEKPLATNSEDARQLVELAQANDRILMVGHISAYNPALRELKQMIDSGDLGDIRYIDAVRVGLGLFHSTLNVIWDLAPHDVSTLLHLLGEPPQSVSARGIACVQESIEDVAYMTLMFPSGILAHSRMSWLDPRKTRRVTVVGTRKMVVYDDVESHEKLKIYDKRVSAVRRTDTFGEFQFAYHYGSVVSPYIDFEEPLRLECLHFVECVSEHKQPLTDGRNGVRVVEVIESAQRSLRQGGIPVPINGDRGAAPTLREVVTIQSPVVAGHAGAFSNGEITTNPEKGVVDRAVLTTVSTDALRRQNDGEPLESPDGDRPLVIDLTSPSIDGDDAQATRP
jgi:predicted dehydrogenase